MYLSLTVAIAQFGEVKVAEIMSRPVITVTPDTGIKEAARLLVERGISGLARGRRQGWARGHRFRS